MMDVRGFTYTPTTIVQDLEFSWTIHNFSSSEDVLRGPSVPTIPGFQENLCFELIWKCSCDCLSIYLKDLNVEGCNFTVLGSIYFRTIEGDTILEANISRREFKGSIELLSYYCRKIKSELNLFQDKLVVKCKKLSISASNVAPSVSSLRLLDRSEPHSELRKDLKAMYESGSSSDICFLVEGKKLPAHKNILASRSPVFAKMFDSDMSESNSNEVVIEDADFHAFNCFLVFLYTSEVEDKKCDTVLSLYSLAHKYQVTSLHAICLVILGNSMTTDSVCRVLVLSDLHGDEELTEAAKFYIRCNILQIAGTTEWAEMVLAKPQLVKKVQA